MVRSNPDRTGDEDGMKRMRSGTTDWTPSPGDLQWVRNLVYSLKEGGVWSTRPPLSINVYKIFDSTKRVEMLSGKEDLVHWRTVKCFEALGFKVYDNRNTKADPDEAR